MAVDVIGETFHQIEDEFPSNSRLETESKSDSYEPNLALIDYSDGIWQSDSFTSACAAIKDRYMKTNKRLEKYTSADILACIKFENTGDDDCKKKQNKNRRVRFSTGMSISVDSLVQCNSDQQAESKEDVELNKSTDTAESQFLEQESATLPPHMHLTAGENKIQNAYLEDMKTVGYGRRCWNQCPLYNNSFDPRLKFHGLQDELNIASSAGGFDKHRQTDLFNCALTLQDPAGFASSYLNSYRTYLKDLDAAVCVSEVLDSEAEDSESNTNLQEAHDVPADENRLLEKLESVKYLWRSEGKATRSPNLLNAKGTKTLTGLANTKTKLETGSKSKEINLSNAQKKSETYRLSSDLSGITFPIAPGPNVYQDAYKIKAKKKFIVHTTSLRSDGQSTETLIHEAILKTPSPAACVKYRNYEASKNTNVDQEITKGIYERSVKDMSQIYSDKEAIISEKSPEDCDDDSDATLTPGEEDIETQKAGPTDTGTEQESRIVTGPGPFSQDNTDAARQNPVQSLSPLTDSDRRFIPFTEISRDGKKESNIEPKRQTQLRATTEPFIPTSHRQQAQTNEEPKQLDTEAVKGGERTAQQTIVPTSSETVYQTSDLFQRPATPEDVSKPPPPLLWYSYQLPYQPRIDVNNPVQQQPQCQIDIHQSHQELQQHHYQLQVQTRGHEIPRPHDIKPEIHVHRQQQQSYSAPGTPAHIPQHPPQDSNAQHFTPHVHAHYNSHYQHKVGHGHHIPVRTSTRNHKHRAFHHNSGIAFAQSSQYRRQSNSLQGQPSNQQPIYNSFWLQFNSNINFQQRTSIQPPQHNIMPNFTPSDKSSAPEVPQRYDNVAQVEVNRRLDSTDLVSQTGIQQFESQNIRMQNSYVHISHQFNQSIIGPERSGPESHFSASGNPRAQLLQIPAESDKDTPGTADSNTNNNANMSEENGNDDKDLQWIEPSFGEVQSCMIDVLENSGSREKYRALKKSRPIRSCLVSVI